MISDLSRATELRYATLRYFNVAGCHLEWGIGTKTRDTSFLIPSVMQVACGEKQMVTVFGDDYDTPDGTCIRDYISVVDLCEAHLLAYKALDGNGQNQVFNIGTGHGLSVMEIIRHAEKVTGKSIRYELRGGAPAMSNRFMQIPRKPSNFWGGQVTQAQRRCCGVHGNGRRSYRGSLLISGSPRPTKNEPTFFIT
ncbi:UDP-glucose 4-epimerase [Anaerolineaceae bacterium]|nr:UDP-glucose 4-epimerase [Anaerolineaceae bacterium]